MEGGCLVNYVVYKATVMDQDSKVETNNGLFWDHLQEEVPEPQACLLAQGQSDLHNIVLPHLGPQRPEQEFLRFGRSL